MILNTAPVSLNGSYLEKLQKLTFPGIKIDRLGGTDVDVKARIGKARPAFTSQENVWKSSRLSTETKLS